MTEPDATGGAPKPAPVADADDGGRVAEVAELVRRFCIADGNAVIYGIEHPLAAGAIREAHTWLMRMLERRQGPVVLNITEDTLLFEGFPVDKRNAQVTRLVNRLNTLHVNNLHFRPGITVEEYASLFEIMAMKAADIEANGGVRGLLELAGIRTVVVGGASYVLVDEHQRVVGRDDVVVPAKEAGASEGDLVAYMSRHVLSATAQKEWMLAEIKNNPAKVAALIADGIGRAFAETGAGGEQETIQSLIENIKLVGYTLMDEQTGDVKDGDEELKDAVLELEKEIQSRARQLMTNDASTRFVSDILGVITTYSDQVRVKRIAREFLKGESNLKTTEKMLRSLSGRTETGEELLIRLRDTMLKQGVKEEDLHELLQRVRRKPAAARARRKSFDSALADGIRQRVGKLESTDAEEAVQNLTTFVDNKLKEKEREFRAQAEQLQSSILRRDVIIESIIEGGVVTWDAEGRVDYLNARARAQLGLEPGFRLGPAALARLGGAAASGPLAPEEESLVAAIGRVITAENGAPVGALLKA